MRRILAATLFLAVQAPAPIAAAADSPADAATSDIRCFVAVAYASTLTQDQAMRANLGMGVTYYLGRLKGRDPGIDLKARIVAEAKKMEADPAGLRSELSRCGQEMVAVGRETQDIGAALQPPKPAS